MNEDSSIDDVLRALADARRRIVVRELASESPSEVTVDALEEAVLRDVKRLPAVDRSSTAVEIQLRHVHLPVLEEAGLCRYDPGRERVEYRPDEFAESLLAVIEDELPQGQRH